LLALLQSFRMASSEVAEKAMDGCKPHITRSGRVLSSIFEVLEKPYQPLRSEILQVQNSNVPEDVRKISEARSRGRAEKGWADRVCSGVVIGNYSGPNGERGENETPSSENDTRAGGAARGTRGCRDGERAAAIYTLTGSAKLNGIAPEAHLSHILYVLGSSDQSH